MQWHLIGLICCILDGRNGHVLLGAPVAVIERSVEQLKLSWDGRCALVASWYPIILITALKQLIAANLSRRDRFF